MGTHEITLTVDGTDETLEVESRTLLIHALRDELGYTGPKVGCETSSCGACTVHLDGEAVKSCAILAVQADGTNVTTVEGMAAPADEGGLHPIQESFHEEHGLQCGYCTPGMIMATAELLAEDPAPSRDEIRAGLKGNRCRCTGYHNVVSAVETAASRLESSNPAEPSTAGKETDATEGR